MVLNKGQDEAVIKGSKWLKKRLKNPNDNSIRGFFEISGPAGSGKTFVVNELIKRTGFEKKDFLFMAFVGKATLALRLNGINANTICSSIYDVVKSPSLSETGEILMKYGRPILTNKFVLKDHIDENIIGFVLDECGMVNESMGKDILSFNKPVFALGDLNQLPPVIGKSFFLDKPDIILKEIMRQQKDSNIIYLSQLAIHGIPIPYGVYGDDCVVIRKSEMTNEHLTQADMILCGTNRTRDTINTYIRRNICGIDSPNLQIGDKIICRQNEWDITLQSNDNIALVNGLVGYIEDIHFGNNIVSSSNCIDIDFRPEFTTEMFNRIPVNNRYPFLRYEKRRDTNTMFLDGIAFELGHALTTHLAQGSQADTVLVYVERMSNSLYMKKWLYTAITRAKKKLILVF